MNKAEQFIEDYTHNCSNQIINGNYGAIIPIFAPWLTPKQALRAVEIEREELIDKACEAFCKIECGGHPPRSTCTSLGTCSKYDDFKKAMQGE